MSSGVTRMVTGSFVGTGSAVDVKTVGFRPRRVELFNVTGLAVAHWTDAMADASMVKQVTAGTMTFPTSNGVTPLANGFRLGADGDMNVAAETVHWVAHE